MRFFAVIVALLAIAAALVCVGSVLRGDVLQAWLTGSFAVLLAIWSGLAWGSDRK